MFIASPLTIIALMLEVKIRVKLVGEKGVNKKHYFKLMIKKKFSNYHLVFFLFPRNTHIEQGRWNEVLTQKYIINSTQKS